MHSWPQCPKCAGRMAVGFVIDDTYGAYRVSAWQRGEPEESLWTGVKRSKPDQLAVETYRCERCGFLESYAR